MAIPYERFKFQVTPLGTAHEVMDAPLIAHCVTSFPKKFVTKAVVGEGVGVGSPWGARTSPSCGVCGTPVTGSIGSEASAAAATVMPLAERPVPGAAADRLLLLLPVATAAAGRGAHPTPSWVMTKSPLLGNRSTALPPALPQVYETGAAVALALRSNTRRPTKAPS